MKRSLLPYEHQLIEALEVSEEDYLDFLAVTKDFTKSPEEVLEKPQATVAVASLVLTIVGIIFQVAGALLAPTPKEQMQRRNREQRFSPRFGFNSSQELAQYGDPINLVYCNTAQNKRGAVRVSTSLVWSAVRAYGSSQFMQLLLVVGASKVKQIDFERTAFGQLPLGQFSGSNTWLYYNEEGAPLFNDKKLGDKNDPARDGAESGDNVCRIIDGGRRLSGYSQTFTPSSLTSIGVYDPVPINVDIQERRTSGRTRWASIGITIQGGSWKSGANNRYDPGEKLTLVFRKAFKRQDNVAQEAAKNLRYQLVASLDQAATYMLGSAEFRLLSYSEDTNLDKDEVRATFECVTAGRIPSTPYDETKAKKLDEQDEEEIEAARDILEAPAIKNRLSGPTILFRTNSTLQRSIDDVTDDQEYSRQTAQSGDVVFGFAGQRYNFAGTKTIRWENELDERKNIEVVQGGSLASSRYALEEFLSDKPKISTAKLRKELSSDLERVRQLRDDVLAGDYDKDFRKKARENKAAQAIKKEIESLQAELEKRSADNYDLDKKTAKIGGAKVLTDETSLGKKGKKIAELEKQIDRFREDRQAVLDDNVAASRKAYVRFLRDARSPFVGLDGNRYGSGGIRSIKDRAAEIKGENTTDQIGVKAVREHYEDLIAKKEEALEYARYILKNWEDLQGAADDNFYTKCLAKADYAAYQTVTACDIVSFSLRCKLFRRIQGRQKRYGEKDAPDGYKLSDNGIQGRMAFFKVEYKKIGAKNYTLVPIVFAVRRAADQDNFIAFDFKASSTSKHEFRLLPIGDIGAEIRDNGQKQFAFIENNGRRSRYDMNNGDQFKWTGRLVDAGPSLKEALEERGPIYTNEWDLFTNRSDTDTQFSFEGGPEFRVTAVTEQQLGSTNGKYSGMSTMALGVYSGKGVQDLRSITAYVTEGKVSYVVNDNGTYSLSNDSTSYAPDIFADTILDTSNGIGKYAKPAGVDWQSLALAKRFCKNNGLGTDLFMDGVIAEPSSWRQFWAEVAPYSLLELARVGGKDTLVPAVPCSNNGRANRIVNVSALFTAGNILEGSYKEEFIDYGDATQDLIATVIYRDTEVEDVFPRDASVQVSLRGVKEDVAIRQTFDISQYVSNREQAILYGQLLCNQRRWIRKGIEFKTFPTDSPISPGAYIYVDVGLVRWQRASSGIIGEGGTLNAPLSDKINNGTYDILLYRSGGKVVSLPSVAIIGANNDNPRSDALADYTGYMFVLGVATSKKRVFRTTEVAMDEEGEITVKAVEHPCEESGSQLLSQVANFDNSLFRIV